MNFWKKKIRNAAPIVRQHGGWKTVALTCGILTAVLFAGGQAQAAAVDTSAKVQVNDALVSFPESQPFIDESGVLQVPLRTVMEAMGYKLEWSQKNADIQVTIGGGAHTAVITTNDANATIDGKPRTFEHVPQFVNGAIYVPVRWIADTFGSIMQWDNDNWIAILGADGKFHSPAWYKPKPDPAADLIDVAEQYMGTPYVTGGSTPNGFDCSGFVQYVFDKFNVDLPRTSADMYASAGYGVSDPQPGDLVFFADRGRVFHVGLYMGNGQYINASSGKTRGVTVTSLYSSWSQKYYVGAKHVL
ncbi:NlpC/P60 family protein [Paenibacillus sp. MBLB4367]|uniref:C40 family peptidase n=1 Tax=Paenibacillus sp. MBLB4367 TaxID=3384767 RepID=UPI0039081DB0